MPSFTILRYMTLHSVNSVIKNKFSYLTYVYKQIETLPVGVALNVKNI